MRIDEAFPYKVCINLDRRPERWQRVQERFAAHGITNVQRFAAIDGNTVEIPGHWKHTAGAWGCLQSHLAVVEEARRRGAPSVLIFEDDVVFDDGLEEKFAAGYRLPVAGGQGGALHDSPPRQPATGHRQPDVATVYRGALDDAPPRQQATGHRQLEVATVHRGALHGTPPRQQPTGHRQLEVATVYRGALHDAPPWQPATGNRQLNWDLLYFGALHKDEPIPVTDHLARLTRSNSTYAYALRETVYDAFIELNRRAADVLDNNSFVLQERFNCLCFLPHLAWVEQDWSDAQVKIEGHWYLQESLVLFGAGADRLLGDTAVVLAHDGRDPANLLYLVQYYREFFTPDLAVVIVEQGPVPTVDEASLPANCRYVLLRDGGAFDRERCFAEGMRVAGERRMAVLSDGDIYLETLDFRANLRMCERYQSATGFSSIVELTAAESQRLRVTNTTRGLTGAKPAQAGRGSAGQCRFVNRSLQATPPFRVFQSPNHALRLQ